MNTRNPGRDSLDFSEKRFSILIGCTSSFPAKLIGQSCKKSEVKRKKKETEEERKEKIKVEKLLFSPFSFFHFRYFYFSSPDFREHISILSFSLSKPFITHTKCVVFSPVPEQTIIK
jgi:hypothetical protein